MVTDTNAEDLLTRRVRDSMGWTREQLAEFLAVSVDTVRKWEDGTNPCAGPAKRLLELLEVWPELPTWLARPRELPPSPGLVPKGSPPWRRLRTIVRQIRRHQQEREQEALFFRIGINQAWLDAATSEGLIRSTYSSPQGTYYDATERALVWFDIEWMDNDPIDGDTD